MSNLGVTELYAGTSDDAVFEILFNTKVVLSPLAFRILGDIDVGTFRIVGIRAVCPFAGARIALANAETNLWTQDEIAHEPFSFSAEPQACHKGDVYVVHIPLVAVFSVFGCFCPTLPREVHFCLQGAYHGKILLAGIAYRYTQFGSYFQSLLDFWIESYLVHHYAAVHANCQVGAVFAYLCRCNHRQDR